MAQGFWRVRLGAAKKGHNRYEKVFNLCRYENPPCIAVGWGEIDLSQDVDEIALNYETEYEESFEGNGAVQIQRWVNMKQGDHVIAMVRPGTIRAIGEIIRERYYKEDEKFKIEIEGYDNPGKVCFFNRIDVKWITNPYGHIKVKSLGLPESIEKKLLQILTIIKIDKNDYDRIKENMDNLDGDPSPPKYTRKYDHNGKSSR